MEDSNGQSMEIEMVKRLIDDEQKKSVLNESDTICAECWKKVVSGSKVSSQSICEC